AEGALWSVGLERQCERIKAEFGESWCDVTAVVPPLQGFEGVAIRHEVSSKVLLELIDEGGACCKPHSLVIVKPNGEAVLLIFNDGA
ncbi:hypothetical protein LTR17_027135, partial [Elasticomyces elasticus]